MKKRYIVNLSQMQFLMNHEMSSEDNDLFLGDASVNVCIIVPHACMSAQ